MQMFIPNPLFVLREGLEVGRELLAFKRDYWFNRGFQEGINYGRRL